MIPADVITAVAAIVALFGVFVGFGQLVFSRQIAQDQVEDGLSKEYRQVMHQIPTSVFVRRTLTDAEHEAHLDEFHAYLDLTNEQVYLRQRRRISELQRLEREGFESDPVKWEPRRWGKWLASLFERS